MRTTTLIFGTVALGTVLLMQSYLSLHMGATWSGTFWLYHIQLLLGFGSIGWGLFLEFSRGRGLAAIEDLIAACGRDFKVR